MQDTTDATLQAMSVQELVQLQAAIHDAVRAAIRRQNEIKAAAQMAATAKARNGQAAPRLAAAIAGPVDLERERDAWLAARRKG